MPLPFAAFLPLIGSAIGAGSQMLTNASNRNLSLSMYDKQRQDALADWNRQNEYNSPKNQMSRFKEAGLSPHLIYGQTNTAPPVRSTSMDVPKNIAPQFNPESVNPIILGLQMENMKKQGNLMDAQALKTASEIENKNLQNSFLADTYGYRMEGLNAKNLLTGSQYRKTEEEITKIQREIKMIQPRINQIIAQTNLSTEQKAVAAQTVLNLKQTEALLGEKVKSEQYLNSIQQKLQSVGIVGSTLAQILRLFK